MWRIETLDNIEQFLDLDRHLRGHHGVFWLVFYLAALVSVISVLTVRTGMAELFAASLTLERLLTSVESSMLG